MDALRAAARTVFDQEQAFKDDQYTRNALLRIPLITISQYENNTVFGQAAFLRQDLLNKATSTIPNNGAEQLKASLRLVKMDRDLKTGMLLIDQVLFTKLFKEFDIEPYFEYMVARSVYGFYSYKSRLAPETTSTGQTQGPPEFLWSFYVNTVSFTLLWSYNERSKYTRAILIPRESDGIRDREGTFSHFITTLKLHQTLIDNPRFLLYISGIELLDWMDESIAQQLIQVRDAERDTGHGPGTPEQHAPRATKDRLNTWTETARKLGWSSAYLANVTRHIALCKTFFDELCNRPIVDATSELLKSRLAPLELHVSYLQERVKTQQDVIFNLLAREDAHTSSILAAAAKRDSSHMKTIAVVTMAFLPAAFYATLFAMPTLKWDDDNVISGRFKVYWYFTVPTTIAVFLLWGITSQWKKVVRKYQQINWNGLRYHRKRNQTQTPANVGNAIPPGLPIHSPKKPKSSTQWFHFKSP